MENCLTLVFLLFIAPYVFGMNNFIENELNEKYNYDIILEKESESFWNLLGQENIDRFQTQYKTKNFTPAHVAAAFNLPVLAKIIASQKNINSADSKGLTALHYATKADNCEATSILLKNGANIDSQCLKGKTALHIASKKSSLGLIKLLFNFNPNLNILDICGNSILHNAIYNRQAIEVIKLLLAREIDINGVNLNGETPLHIAALHTKPEITRLLINCDASKEILNKNNLTAFALALENNNLKTIKEFIKKGIDVDERYNIKNNTGPINPYKKIFWHHSLAELNHYDLIPLEKAVNSYLEHKFCHPCFSDTFQGDKNEYYNLANINLNIAYCLYEGGASLSNLRRHLSCKLKYITEPWYKLYAEYCKITYLLRLLELLKLGDISKKIEIIDMIKYVSKLEFNLNLTDLNNNRYIDYAFELGDFDIIFFLLYLGAKIDYITIEKLNGTNPQKLFELRDRLL